MILFMFTNLHEHEGIAVPHAFSSFSPPGDAEKLTFVGGDQPGTRSSPPSMIPKRELKISYISKPPAG